MADNVSPLRDFQLEDDPPPAPSPQANAAIGVLMLALKTLSQRAILAFIRLFTLLTVGAAFWLWMSIPDPSVNQLISLGMYAVFTLVVNWIALRRPA